MLREIGISESRARYLMSIGRSLNRLNSDDLPRSIDALYVLSRLDADEIEQHIETGTITRAKISARNAGYDPAEQ